MDTGAPAPVLIVSIGTRHGEDEIAIQLMASILPQLQLKTKKFDYVECESPATGLLTLLAPDRITVLIDAVIDAGEPGDVIDIDVHELLEDAQPLSSHNLSVAEVLSLAKALNQLPSQLRIIGICASEAHPLSASGRVMAAERLQRNLLPLIGLSE